MTFGSFLRRQRARIPNLNQSDVAAMMGKSTTWMNRLENDQFKEFPSPDEIRQLAEILRTTETDLMRAAGYATERDMSDERAIVYTYVENNEDLTDYQKQVIFGALDDAERRRRELEGIDG